MIPPTILTKPCIRHTSRMSNCSKTLTPLKSVTNDLDRIGNMIFYILCYYIKITSMKDTETDYISASEDASVSLLITFVFIKIMKVLCKLLENLFRALTIARV